MRLNVAVRTKYPINQCSSPVKVLWAKEAGSCFRIQTWGGRIVNKLTQSTGLNRGVRIRHRNYSDRRRARPQIQDWVPGSQTPPRTNRRGSWMQGRGRKRTCNVKRRSSIWTSLVRKSAPMVALYWLLNLLLTYLRARAQEPESRPRTKEITIFPRKT